MNLKMTIGRRIGLSSAVVCAMIAVLTAFAILQLNRINSVVKSIDDDSLPGLIDAATATHLLAENQILLRRLVASRTDEARKQTDTEMEALSASISKAMADYEATIRSDEDRRMFDVTRERRAEYLRQRSVVMQLLQSDQSKAEDYLTKDLQPAYIAYSAAGTALMEYNRKAAADAGQRLMADMRRSIRILLIVGLLTLAVGIATALVNSLKIGRSLRAITGQIDEGSGQVDAAASQVSASSSLLAQGASEQAASLEETSASLEEMAGMTRRNAENSAKAKETARGTRDAADSGAEQMKAMRLAMEAIRGASEDITKILKTIDEIAFQTNILALNAAVEAARAGDAGAGFAVVADEVRALAQRAAAAAKETAGKIEDSVAKSQQGAHISAKVEESFESIRTKIRQLDDLVSEIATASMEQTQGIEQVTKAVAEMDRVTQSNASGAEETASAAEELSAQSKTLKELVDQLTELTGRKNAAPVDGSPSLVPQAA